MKNKGYAKFGWGSWGGGGGAVGKKCYGRCENDGEFFKSIQSLNCRQ